ncbi:SIR2 family NAD-dependent protein deacylase [Noviherbaspirillum sp. Root189]|uniref:SIR2 family NAD-dependent protein deacylase n=1 Tax=Noviherbaspirillum sp. Root189 TaxID=1736487 RepID=UPI00070DF8FC|nr:NAD-dependent deacylase [Noviherbaspirillum sp. Root189]KRB92301.1 NAD-dependent deacylase [Noviherbaspirillum sp. Root189]
MLFDFVLLEKLRSARHIAVFTGAGVSAESGIPTFRDAQTGLWAKFRAEDLATPEAFRRDPVTVWNWYAWRRELMADAGPNPAHLAIAQMQQVVPELTVITQNVDGLHAKAGSANVIELHGNIWNDFCADCRQQANGKEGTNNVPPRCTHCGGMLRPGVVWFGEALPADAWTRASDVLEVADVFFCIGTSSLVEPAASLPRYARSCGRTVVQINPEATSHDEIAQYVLRGKAGEVLPQLVQAAWPQVMPEVP